MVNESVGALHVALAAAVVGWLVFSISHAVAVWKKRNADGKASSSRSLLYISLLLCAAAMLGGWLDRELTRRAGVIQGTDFFVVRAHGGRVVPHLAQGGSVSKDESLVRFDDPDGDREEEHLRGEIAILENQIASERLKPLVLDPELLRESQDASDSQRARLTQLGYGVLHGGHTTPDDDEPFVAAQRAQNAAAKLQYERTVELVKDGIIAREKLDSAAAAAQLAAQQLLERQRLIESARAGSAAVARTEAAIGRDGSRARAERVAELAELNAHLAELRTTLLQLQSERSVAAPFAGTIVYRHSTPALAAEGQVILALAKGHGFVATIQIPAREASLLVPGQALQMKLTHSLVSNEISGRLESIQPVTGYTDRRNIQIACDLPAEQFAAFSSGGIPVTLEWRPSLLTNRLTQTGLALSLLSLLLWIGIQIRTSLRRNDWSRAWPSSPEEENRVLAQLELSTREFAGQHK